MTRRVLAGLLLLGSLPLSACDGNRTPSSTGSTHAHGQDDVVRDDTYEGVRGVVVALPAPGDKDPQARIHHEHIPHFRTKEGTVFVTADGVPGMKSMVMPFPIADGLDVSGLAVGDKIVFDFTVHWGGERPWEMTRFEKLDPETEIDFTNKTADGAPGDDDHAGHDHP